MRKINPVIGIVLTLTIYIPAAIQVWVFINQYGKFKESPVNYGYCLDYTVTSDGKFAWAAMELRDKMKEITLRLVDIASETVLEEYTVPATFDRSTFLFTQDSEVYLAVPTSPDDDEKVFCYIYNLRQGQAPLLISDDLRMIDSDDEPIQWQNRIIFLGKNAEDRYTMSFIENKAIHTIDLETSFPELESNIRWVELPGNGCKVMPVYRFALYDNTEFCVGPLLESSGLPMAIGTTDENERELAAKAAVEMVRSHYESKLLGLKRGEKSAEYLVTFDSSALLGVFSDHPYAADENCTLLEAPKFFNAATCYLDRNSVLVAGTKTANPESECLLFLYNIEKESLKPIADNISRSASGETFKSNTLAWREGELIFVKNRYKTPGILMNLDDGTASFPSFALFESIKPLGAGGTFQQYLFLGDGIYWLIPVLLVGGLPSLIILLLFWLNSSKHKRHKDAVASGVHLKAIVLEAEWTGIIYNKHYHETELELEFDYLGQTQKGKAKILLNPWEMLHCGDELYIAYNPKNRKITVLNDDDELNISNEGDGSIIYINKKNDKFR